MKLLDAADGFELAAGEGFVGRCAAAVVAAAAEEDEEAVEDAMTADSFSVVDFFGGAGVGTDTGYSVSGT